MTQLAKPVRREAANSRTHSGRALVVTLMPGASETIIIKEKGRRKGYEVPLLKVYQLGARLEADAQRTAKAQKRKAKKGARP